MTAASTPLSRPLRDIVYERLRDEIIAGTLAPRDRLKVGALAKSSRISPTPVREALLRLEREGFLHGDHNKGFSVAELDPVEIRQTYPIIGGLESAALRDAGLPDPGTIVRLKEINRQLGLAGSAKARLATDLEWHRTLIAAARNDRLAQVIALNKEVVRRYENRYMRDASRVFGSVEAHSAILQALETGDVLAARGLLEKHWEDSMVEVLGWIESESERRPKRRHTRGRK